MKMIVFILLLAAIPSAAAPPVDQKQLNEGYSLLYDIVSKQKLSDKILLIKFESKEVKSALNGIAETASRIQKGLDELAKQDPSLELKLEPLPFIETETRKSANFERVKDLLGKSGKEFERLLLLTQSGLLNTERHLSKVLSEKESNEQRKKFMQGVNRQFEEQYRKVVQLLEAKYFSPIGKADRG